MRPEPKLRAVIVDDEAMARQRLTRLLESDPGIEIAAECADGPEALEVLEREVVDLLFLDIQMPEMDGFAVLDALPRGCSPVVVMVTAYDKYAIRAFEARALDYVLKPFHRERFGRALDRAKAQVALLRRNGPAPASTQPLTLRTGRSVVLVTPGEIDWAEAAGNYVCVHAGGVTHVARETLASLLGRLSGGNFVKIHRSVIVNTERIREVAPVASGDYSVLLRDGTRLAGSRTYRGVVEALRSAG
ncbi:MAG: LytTR family DNA-binding domain-containing protein [Bryobacteraceae bacterium]